MDKVTLVAVAAVTPANGRVLLKPDLPATHFSTQALFFKPKIEEVLSFILEKENAGTALLMKDYSDIIGILWSWAVC